MAGEHCQPGRLAASVGALWVSMRTAVPTRPLWLLASAHRANCTFAQNVHCCAPVYRYSARINTVTFAGSRWQGQSTDPMVTQCAITTPHNTIHVVNGCRQGSCSKNPARFPRVNGPGSSEPVSGLLCGSDDDGCRQNRAKRPFSATVLIFSAPTATDPRYGWSIM